MTTSRALTDRILVPMVRVTADGLARLGLEPAPEAWDESGADPFAVATDGVSSTDSASPAEAVAIGFRTAAVPAPNASAEDAGTGSAIATNSLPSLQPRGRDSALPWPGERAPDPAMHEAAAPASASAMINHPDAVAIPAPTASAVVEADNILTDLGYDNKMLTDLGYKGPAGERDSKLFGMPMQQRLRTFQVINKIPTTRMLDTLTVNRLLHLDHEKKTLKRAQPYSKSKLPESFNINEDSNSS